MNGYFLLGLGLVGFGVLLIVSGILKKGRCSCKAAGRITDIRENVGTDIDDDKTYSYSPEYEYDVDGQRYHGVGDRSYSNPNRIKIGGNIDVYYNPEKPGEHYTKGGVKVGYWVAIGAIFFGVLSILSQL